MRDLFHRLVRMPFVANRRAPRSLLHLRHRYYTRKGFSTFVVYTMGKVGSTSVYTSLRQSRLSPLIYHVHFLTDANLHEILKRYDETGSGQTHQRLSIINAINGDMGHVIASQTLRRVAKHGKWKIISIVRDPVETFVSHVFQNPQTHRPQLIGDGGSLDQQRVEDYVREFFRTFPERGDYIANWFDDEFRAYTGIDVYQHEFETGLGYSIIRSDRYDLAIIALDRVESALPAAASELTKQSVHVGVARRNERISEENGDIYRDVKRDLVVPREYLNKVYATKYATHFLSAEQRSRSIDYWSAVRTQTSSSTG